MTPVNIGERSVPDRISSCVRSFRGGDVAADLARVFVARPRNEKTGKGFIARPAPTVGVVDRTAVDARGVPVLRRPTRNGNARSLAASRFDGGSPARPPGDCSRPTWIFPPRNVPNRKYDRASSELEAHRGDDAANTVEFDPEVGDFGLEQRKVGWHSTIERIAFL